MPRALALLILALTLTACGTSTEPSGTSSGEVRSGIRLTITSSSGSIPWTATVSDRNGSSTITGTTPFTQDFPDAGGGLTVKVSKSAPGGEVLTACLVDPGGRSQSCSSTNASSGTVTVGIAD